MRRLLLGLMLAVVTAIGSSSAAYASNGATTHFTALYPLLIGEIYNCTGVHIDSNATAPGSKDSETCNVTGNVSTYVAGTFKSGVACPAAYGLPPGTECGVFPPYIGQPGIIDGLVNWFSDFNGASATKWTLTLSANPDGTFTNEIVAYYATA